MRLPRREYRVRPRTLTLDDQGEEDDPAKEADSLWEIVTFVSVFSFYPI